MPGMRLVTDENGCCKVCVMVRLVEVPVVGKICSGGEWPRFSRRFREALRRGRKEETNNICTYCCISGRNIGSDF